jgi:hypothetical protein
MSNPARKAIYHSAGNHAGSANHWADAPCPIARRFARYACPGSGVTHRSGARLRAYRFVDAAGTRVGRQRLRGLLEAELARDPMLAAMSYEHAAQYDGRGEVDETRAGEVDGRPALRVRGCARYRSAVAERLRALCAAYGLNEAR